MKLHVNTYLKQNIRKVLDSYVENIKGIEKDRVWLKVWTDLEDFVNSVTFMTALPRGCISLTVKNEDLSHHPFEQMKPLHDSTIT